MSEFEGLDLQAVEEQIDDERNERTESHSVVLGVLDGTTDDEEWVRIIAEGNVLVLNIQGELNDLASGFARPVKDIGADLVHFRGFLIVTPAGISIDKDRL